MFPQDYLDMVGLSAMFPRVEVFLIQGSPVDMLERPPMDGKDGTFSYSGHLIHINSEAVFLHN